MTGPAFDARALVDPVDPRQVSAYAAQLRASGALRPSGGTVFAIVIAVLVGVIMIPILLAVAVGTLMHGAGNPVAWLPVLLIGGGAVVIGIISVHGWRSARVARYRLNRFAQANSMSYIPRITDPPLPGMIFGLGRNRMSTDIVRGTSPRFVEFGNFQYTVQSGKSSTTYRWGYVAVKLDVPLPNIVLDAKGNNTLGSNLPASFSRSQRLSLEGDFDQHFALYCPEGYERDALYLFTPDIMARFIDDAAELDVEIVDDWLFLYTQRRASTLDADTWGWLFGAVGALLQKFDQWGRWRDDRLLAENAAVTASALPAANTTGAPLAAGAPFAAPVGMLTPPPGVAFQGRRLKRGVSWATVIAVVIVIAFYAMMVITDLR